MAHSESAMLSDEVQMSSKIDEVIKSKIDEQIIPLIKSQIEEQIKPLIKSIASQSESVDQEKTEASLPKAEVEGTASGGLKYWERIAVIVVGLSVIVSATWFLGNQLGVLSSDVNGLREQNKIQFNFIETQFKDIKDGLKRIDDRLYNLEQKQTE